MATKRAVSVGLTVNGDERAATVARGDFVRFLVTVAAALAPADEAAAAGRRRLPAIRIGDAKRPWHARLELRVGAGGRGRRMPRRLQALGATPRRGALRLDGAGMGVLELGIDPEDVARIPAGRYPVRAMLAGVAGVEGASGEATLVVRAAARGRTLSPERLLAEAEYFLARGRLDGAAAAVEALERRSPGSLEAHYARGRLEEARRRPAAAIESYERAVAAFERRFPRDPEGPQAILARIVRLAARRPLTRP